MTSCQRQSTARKDRRDDPLDHHDDNNHHDDRHLQAPHSHPWPCPPPCRGAQPTRSVNRVLSMPGPPLAVSCRSGAAWGSERYMSITCPSASTVLPCCASIARQSVASKTRIVAVILPPESVKYSAVHSVPAGVSVRTS